MLSGRRSRGGGPGEEVSGFPVGCAKCQSTKKYQEKIK